MSICTLWPRSAAASVAVCMLTVACASAPTEGSRTERTRIAAGNATYDIELTRDRIHTQHLVDASADAVWKALPAAYAALGLEGVVVDPTARQFGVPRYRLASRRMAARRLSDLFSCGSSSTGSNADSYEVRYLMVTRLNPEGGSTEVETLLEAVAHPRSVSGQSIQCASTGVLEQMLVDTLTARVGAFQGPEAFALRSDVSGKTTPSG